MITYALSHPVTAQYWRLKAAENAWVGLTEFVLRPLIDEPKQENCSP